MGGVQDTINDLSYWFFHSALSLVRPNTNARRRTGRSEFSSTCSSWGASPTPSTRSRAPTCRRGTRKSPRRDTKKWRANLRCGKLFMNSVQSNSHLITHSELSSGRDPDPHGRGVSGLGHALQRSLPQERADRPDCGRRRFKSTRLQRSVQVMHEKH